MARLPESLLQQSLAVRSVMVSALEAQDALITRLQELVGEEPEIAPEFPPVDGCAHPKNARVDTTTGGGSAPSFFCPGCKRTSDEIKAHRPEGGS